MAVGVAVGVASGRLTTNTVSTNGSIRRFRPGGGFTCALSGMACVAEGGVLVTGLGFSDVTAVIGLETGPTLAAVAANMLVDVRKLGRGELVARVYKSDCVLERARGGKPNQ